MTVRILIGDCRDAAVTQRTSPNIRKVAVCKACDRTWITSTGRITEACPQCGRLKDVRVRRSSPRNLDGLNKWRSANPNYSTTGSRKSRRSALLRVGDGVIKCVRCGCDFESVIEINHKAGGGQKDLKGRSQQFYRDVALFRRAIDDLELLCKPCNSVHALELLHGPLPFRVTWRAE